MQGRPCRHKTSGSLFQSVTTRTAGFNTIDLTKLSDSGIMLMIVLMLIGGAPGSTAGGMKTTTFFVLLVSTFAVFGSKRSASVFHRRISAETIRKAAALFMTYITLFLLAAMIISRIEGPPLLTCMFETASAIGTVGLTLGITPLTWRRVASDSDLPDVFRQGRLSYADICGDPRSSGNRFVS